MRILSAVKKFLGPYPFNPVFIFIVSFIYFFTRFGPALTELSPGFHRQFVAIVIVLLSAIPSLSVALTAWGFQKYRLWNPQNFLFYCLEIFGITLVLRAARIIEMKIPFAAKYVSNKQDLIKVDIYLYFWGFVAILLLNGFLSFAERETIGKLKLAKDLASSLNAERRELVVANEEGKTQISSFLHDRVQSDLMLISMQLKELERDFPNFKNKAIEEIISKLESIRGTDLRKLIEILDPDLSRHTLEEAIKTLSNHYKNSFHTHLSIAKPDSVINSGSQVELGIYRIVEQFLLNALIHAKCRNVWIELRFENNTLVLTLRDDGIGTTNAEIIPGYGTALINSWVDVLGGSKEIHSSKTNGYLLKVAIPISSVGVID